MDSGFQWSFCFNFHDVSRMLHDCFCSVRVYTAFCDSLCAIVLQSVRFFRRKAFVVSWYTFVVVSSFRTILSSSNGNICYSLYTLSVVVVGFCFTLVTVGLSFFFSSCWLLSAFRWIILYSLILISVKRFRKPWNECVKSEEMFCFWSCSCVIFNHNFFWAFSFTSIRSAFIKIF